MENQGHLNITAHDSVYIVEFDPTALAKLTVVTEVAEHLDEFISNKSPQKVVIDFTGVSFLSSRILGMLVDVWKKINAYNGRLVISGINPKMSRVFRISSLDKILEFYETRKEAVEAL